MGYILSVKAKNIYVANPRDVGSRSDFSTNKDLFSHLKWLYYEYNGILSPDNLVKQSVPDSHNEVVITSGSGNDVFISGIFYRTDWPHRLDSQEIAEIENFANELNVPLIKL